MFVLGSDKADLKLKFFTPGHEINLCGHATMASLYCLKSRGLIKSDFITIETNIGLLPIEFLHNNGITMKMKQGNPQFVSFEGDTEKLLHSIGLASYEYDANYPIVYGSTGTWTLLIPIKDLNSFSKMKPINSLFPIFSLKIQKHPYTRFVYKRTIKMHLCMLGISLHLILERLKILLPELRLG